MGNVLKRRCRSNKGMWRIPGNWNSNGCHSVGSIQQCYRKARWRLIRASSTERCQSNVTNAGRLGVFLARVENSRSSWRRRKSFSRSITVYFKDIRKRVLLKTVSQGQDFRAQYSASSFLSPNNASVKLQTTWAHYEGSQPNWCSS